MFKKKKKNETFQTKIYFHKNLATKLTNSNLFFKIKFNL